MLSSLSSLKNVLFMELIVRLIIDIVCCLVVVEIVGLLFDVDKGRCLAWVIMITMSLNVIVWAIEKAYSV